MRVSTDLLYNEEECPIAVEPLLDAIEHDDQIGSTGMSMPRPQRRACEIIKIMCDREAYPRSDTSEEPVAGVTAPELDETGQFSTTQQTLRQSLKALEKYGYLERKSTEPPYQFTIADDWVDMDADVEATADTVVSPADTNVDECILAEVSDDIKLPVLPTKDDWVDVEATANAVGSAADTNVDECISAEVIDDVKSPVSPTNYQRVSMLVTEAAANLTPAQRLVAGVFGNSGIIVGVGSGGLLAVGTQLSPHLVAAGESGLLASVTLLFGWLWLHFVGFVAGDTAGREEHVVPSETA